MLKKYSVLQWWLLCSSHWHITCKFCKQPYKEHSSLISFKRFYNFRENCLNIFLCFFLFRGQYKPETFEWIIPVLVVQSDKLLEFLSFHLQVLVPLSQVPVKKVILHCNCWKLISFYPPLLPSQGCQYFLIKVEMTSLSKSLSEEGKVEDDI